DGAASYPAGAVPDRRPDRCRVQRSVPSFASRLARSRAGGRPVMTQTLHVALLACCFAASLVCFFLSAEHAKLRNFITLGSAALKLVVIAFLLAGVVDGIVYETRLELVLGLYLLLRVDALALLFVTQSVFLWLVTT